jgi:hypothetical protein
MMKAAMALLLGTLALGAETFTGVITDSMCGRDHSAMGVTPTEKCVKECMKHGKHVKYVLDDGKNLYKLSDQQTPEKFAAKKVKVTGKLHPKTGIIAVEKIEAAK